MMSSAATSPLKKLLDQPGQRRVGPFELVRPLGRGGHAPVWLAREVYGSTELRLAAVKLFPLRPGKTQKNGATRSETERHQVRVIEEAKALCRVEHPSIARFYSIARDDEAAVLGVAMEYLTGASLEARIGERGKLPIDEALTVGASIASALSAVHRSGLVHRDVKPANIVDSAGTYKLIDFGIAWEDSRDAEIATLPVLVDDLPLEVSAADKGRIAGAVTFRAEDFVPTQGSKSSSARAHSGTVGYVDPETLRTGAVATPASDIYALGVVLFECVSGLHPAAVAAASGEGLKQEVLDGREPAPTLASIVPGTPPSLSSLVERMLSATPANRPRTADWIAIELERIRAEVAGAKRNLPPEAQGPFRGLGRFEEDDRDIYFGRSSEIAAAIELMRAHGLVALVGPSGSGKSSLARAGVLPRVREGALGRGLARCDIATIAPANDPRRAVLEALAGLPDPPFTLEEGRDMLPAAVVTALATRAQVSERGTLLFVDQLEEIVTMEASSFAASRKWTIELLVALAQSSVAGVRALVTARRDLLEPLLAYEGLGKAMMRGTLLVEPMTDATWDDVIEQSLSAYGYELESPDLAAELARQLRGTVGAMPLVQFALTELWAKRNTTEKKVTRAALDEIGGIAGSLERHAEATLKELLRAGFGSEADVRDLLLPLTTPHGTRASVPLEALVKKDENRRRIVTALEGARLLVSGAGGVTLAHDALLVQWARLRGWLADARERRLLTEALERDARMWSKDPASTSLWVGRRLDAAAELRGDIGDESIRFLVASRRAARRSRELRVAAITILLAMVAIVAMVYVRSVKADRAAAVERAALEESKASVEQSRRIELERAQAELDGRQQKIDALMAELSKAEDPKAILELQRQLKEAQTSAHDSQDKIAAVIPNRPAASTKPAVSAPPPPPSASAVRPKIQREP